jgi:hypothetical protein
MMVLRIPFGNPIVGGIGALVGTFRRRRPVAVKVN